MWLDGYNGGMDLPPVIYIDSETVLRAWRNPPPAHHAPAPKRAPIKLPERWTAVASTATTVNPWVGDMPILADGHYSAGLIEQIRIDASVVVFRASRV